MASPLCEKYLPLAPNYLTFYESKMAESAKNIFAADPAPLDTAVLVLDQSNTLSFAAATDPMRAANRRAGRNVFRWRFCTAETQAATLTTGLRVEGRPIANLEACDLLIIVAGFDLEAQATPRLRASLRRLAQKGTFMMAIDGGPWILARAGLLDSHPATTHWEDLEEFASQFPKVETRRDRYCISPPFATSGGASPAIDLMLHLIAGRWGADLARRTAGAFLYDPVPEGQWQAPTSITRDARRHPAISRALALMAQNLDDPLTIPEVARRIGQSPRRMEQLFQTHLAQSPRASYLAMRLSEAHRLALDTNATVQQIAAATGFNSMQSFARAFRAHYGTSVRALRKR